VTEIPVILNAKSGAGGNDDAKTAIEGAMRQRGLQARVTVLDAGQDIARTVDAELARGASLVVAGGGDGTVNAVAARLVGTPATFGVLPLGTLNHFARDLDIPFDVDKASAIVADNQSRMVDVAEVNGRVFLNNSSMGLYPRIVIERERTQSRLGVGKWPALARAIWHALREPETFNAVVCVDGQELQRRTPFIFVGNNAYVLEGFGIGKRPRLDAGTLSLYVLRPKSAWGFVSLAFRSLLGIGSHADDFESFQATEFRVESQAKSIQVATDGEVNVMNSPIQYRIRPGALRVLAPAHASSEAERGR
jgi:diacylglycerol kinase family enzyme